MSGPMYSPGAFCLFQKILSRGKNVPAVVCQHGLEGLPVDVVTTDPKAEAFRYYKGFAASLADRGYVRICPA